jgi:hypothetical protein
MLFWFFAILGGLAIGRSNIFLKLLRIKGSVMKKYPNNVIKKWKSICAKAPYLNRTIIPQGIISALEKTGFHRKI